MFLLLGGRAGGGGNIPLHPSGIKEVFSSMCGNGLWMVQFIENPFNFNDIPNQYGRKYPAQIMDLYLESF